MRFISIALANIERFPREWQAKVRRASQSGLLVKHLRDTGSAPEILLKAAVLKDLCPQSVICRVPDRL
jgi:hypothetical protein